MKHFAIIGDTQRTMLAERLLLREQNEAERLFIVQKLLEEKPAFVAHLGDLVAKGFAAADWNYFDRLFAGFAREGIPIFPALGNHDLWMNPDMGFHHAATRFPHLRESRWYSKTHGNLGLIWLDTNAHALGSILWTAQARWLETELAKMGRASEVKTVLVFTHHPPYSNSMLTGDTPVVQKTIVPLLEKTAKPLAVFSGHAHGYERFDKNGKHFVVSAGGGGARQPLWQGHRARHADRFEGARLRPFNYVLAEPMHGGVKFTAKGIEKGRTDFRVLETFEIKF